jgi:hypothetical protein
MSIQMESKNNKSRKINKNDLVIAGLLISSALIVAALVLYFHYQPMSASPLKVSVPPKAHIASTRAPVAPSPEPTPVTPMATESPQPSPTSPAPANLAQKKEKRLEVLEAAQAKKQKNCRKKKLHKHIAWIKLGKRKPLQKGTPAESFTINMCKNAVSRNAVKNRDGLKT